MIDIGGAIGHMIVCFTACRNTDHEARNGGADIVK